MGILPGFGGPQVPSPLPLYSVINNIGLATNLKLCLDAGDSASTDGSSQQWTDRSATGTHFYRGTTSSSEATDPTFNGSAGQLSSGEYFSFDGGDFFKLVAASNPAWVETLHKASAKYSMLFWVYLGSLADSNALFEDYARGSVATRGFAAWCQNNTALCNVDNGGVFSMQNATLAATAWTFIGFSVDVAVGTNGAFMRVARSGSDSTVVQSSTYTSPSTAAATAPVRLGTNTNADAAQTFRSGGRLAMVAAWQGQALTQTEMGTIYEETRGRFGV